MANTSKGIALITFTNAAAEHAKSKLVSDPKLLQAPNFVGTIDAFANRFIARPVFKKKVGKNPTFIESWSSLQIDEIRVPGRPKISVPLDDFRLDKTAGATLHPKRNAAGNLSDLEIQRLCKIAGRKIRHLYRAGYVSSNLSRQVAASQKSFEALGTLLAARFEEVIIDEAQDCSEQDLSILRGLKDAGVRIVAVGDLDQSIYEFRGARPDKVVEFFRPVMNDSWKLTDNFRSTQAICDFTATMRVGAVPDRACGQNAKFTTPVFLASFSEVTEVPAAVRTIADAEGIGSKTLLLAHNGDAPRQALGLALQPKTQSKHPVVRVAKHFEVLNNLEASPTERHRALKGCVKLLQDIHAEDNVRNLDPEDFQAYLGLDDQRLRAECLKLAIKVGPPVDRDGRRFKDALVGALDELGFTFSASRLKKPSDKSWQSAFGDEVPIGNEFEVSNIHQYKGLEQESVALIIPKRRGQIQTVNAWVRRESDEALRVLYVGASRAERLLMVFVHESLFGPIANHLEGLGVRVATPQM